MTLPSGDASNSLPMVGSGGHPLVDQGNNRHSKPGGSNGGTIEVVGGGGCAKKKLRRGEEGGDVGCSNKFCRVAGANNIDKNIVIETAEPLCAMNIRWIQDPLFPREVPLFQHLSSFTKNVDIARNGMVEGCLLLNQSTLLPLVGIIVKE